MYVSMYVCTYVHKVSAYDNRSSGTLTISGHNCHMSDHFRHNVISTIDSPLVVRWLVLSA